jgi:hypothetical protein
MAKLQDMFTLARRAHSSGSIGFLGKSRGEAKPRAAAVVLKLTRLQAGSAEAAVKAGADGLLFSWDGEERSQFDVLKSELASAKTSYEEVVSGLQLTGGWKTINRETLTQIRDLGIQYVILPLDAPARLLGQEIKDLEMVVTIPMRSGDMYPLFIRNLTAFDTIAAVLLDFGLSGDVSTMTIEEVLQYRAVREAVRFPALLNVNGDLDKAEVYTLMTLGVQAFILTTSSVNAQVQEQLKSLRSILESIHEEEKEATSRKVGM